MKKLHFHLPTNSEKGQSIVLIALVFIGLLAFIGLTVDMGILFISYGNLRRAVDNASLAAATQMRNNYTNIQLRDSAAQFLHLNDVMVDPATVDVQTCDTAPGDPEICPTGSASQRKLVRVTASQPVEFSFLPVIGFYGTTITSHAVAEAASLDVVLVVDISESMAKFDPTGINPHFLDPANCNAEDPTGVDGIPGECHPFEEVKSAASLTFANWILNKTAAQEEDRIAVVVFSNGWEVPNYIYAGQIPSTGTAVVCPGASFDAQGRCTDPWMNDYNEAYDLITHLQVYNRPKCLSADPTLQDTIGSCSIYTDVSTPTTFQAPFCPWNTEANATTNGHLIDGSTCQTTNIGGGLQLGASLFGVNMRKDALWLLVLLTDGAANATEVNTDTDPLYATGDLTAIKSSLPLGFCPTNGTPPMNEIGCRDNNTTTRHDFTTNPTNYDADDYARDMADLVACDSKTPAAGCDRAGQGALMFGIGLGDTVVTAPVDTGGNPYGDRLLRYIGAVGDDGNPATDPCASVALNSAGYNCGNYYFSSTGTGLNAIFEQIANRVFTRLAR